MYFEYLPHTQSNAFVLFGLISFLSHGCYNHCQEMAPEKQCELSLNHEILAEIATWLTLAHL